MEENLLKQKTSQFKARGKRLMDMERAEWIYGKAIVKDTDNDIPEVFIDTGKSKEKVDLMTLSFGIANDRQGNLVYEGDVIKADYSLYSVFDGEPRRFKDGLFALFLSFENSVCVTILDYGRDISKDLKIAAEYIFIPNINIHWKTVEITGKNKIDDFDWYEEKTNEIHRFKKRVVQYLQERNMPEKDIEYLVDVYLHRIPIVGVHSFREDLKKYLED